ncbi:helix-turn-helix transcriptional regulator [Thermoleophilia bacterium SCSIO 60948]|nr:helix-turn-helix transcriptional regulator [Thermoleophilia bacterium SCSIO 60948]
MAVAGGEVAGRVFDALSDPTRRTIFELISERGEASASALARELPVSRQAVAKHLELLAEAGLVSSARSGRELLFRPTPEPMSEAMRWMSAVGSRWDARLERLGRQLAR